MRYYLCIDDTDNLETPDTGRLSEKACTEMTSMGIGRFSAISRHQLFVHEDVPCTSHNSSMCMEVEECINPDVVVGYMESFLENEAAPGSDPGLCFVPEYLGPEAVERLIRFGRDAKCKVLNKGLAYELARGLGVHLSEHGGTGDGVVGALAGVGLRMAGDDGRYRGWHHLGPEGESMPAGAIVRLCGADQVRDQEGRVLDAGTPVLLREKIKPVRRDGLAVLLARPSEPGGPLQLLPGDALKIY